MGRTRAFAVATAVPWLRGTLAAGLTLAQWAEAQPTAEPRAGRGRVHVVPAPASGPGGRGRWAVRHYFRGGAVARPLLRDRYLSVGTPRPFREILASHGARARGIPTPAVVAGAVYPSGIFHRADLVTELIPDGMVLADVLFGEDRPTPERGRAALAAAGELIRRMERTGVRHVDLNARNILLTWSADAEGAPSVHLLDLDACTLTSGPLPAGPMQARLQRSLRKFERRSGRKLGADAWAALRGEPGGGG
jgi:3-deoxy-D-manno-octulosonic acid kinase